MLSDMLSDGAKILSRDVVQVSLQGKPALKTKTFRGINIIIFESVGACLFVERNRQVASAKLLKGKTWLAIPPDRVNYNRFYFLLTFCTCIT